MKKIVVFTVNHLEKVSPRIKKIAEEAISLNEKKCINQHTLLKVTRSGKYQGISQGSDAFIVFKKPDQDDYLYILLFMPPKEEDPSLWKDLLSKDDFALIHSGDIKYYYKENVKDIGVNFGKKATIDGCICKYKVFSSKEQPWPDFEKLVASINTDERRFQDALDTLFGMSTEELLISMKILFLPAYLASNSNESNVSIAKNDRTQLEQIETTKGGEELQKKWLLGSDDGIGQYFDADGKLIEEIPNFHAKYKELCQLS